MRPELVTGYSEAQHAALHSGRKARLLLVLSIVPWPIRRNGYSLRFAPIVEYLAQRHELDVLVFTEEEDEVVLPSSPLQRCHSLVVMRVPITWLPPWLRKIRTAVRGLWPWGAPQNLSGYPRRRLERSLLRYLDHKNYSAVIWATRHLDVACTIRRRYPGTRFVMDMVDSPALAHFRHLSKGPLLRLLTRYSGWKWRRLERKAHEVFDAAIYISAVDAHAARSGHLPRIHVVPNGIFTADAPPMAKAPLPNRVIGFLGDMSYQPNISAVLRLAQRIFPRILASLADARLLIIGRDPAPAIKQLRSRTITVTGTVDNIWPYIAQANVFVYPMIEGTGLQNKILEGMYAGVPIVTTSIAANGIGGRNGEQLLVADTDDKIVEQVLKVLGDPQYAARLAEQARSFVIREFSWPAILPRYEAIIVTASGNSPCTRAVGASPTGN